MYCIGKLTKLYIEQYEKDKKLGYKERIHMTIQDFYKGIIKIVNELEKQNYGNKN